MKFVKSEALEVNQGQKDTRRNLIIEAVEKMLNKIGLVQLVNSKVNDQESLSIDSNQYGNPECKVNLDFS